MKRGSDAAGFSSSVREGEGPRLATDAASMAEGLPGVHVRRLGADDGFATLSIRGSSSSQVAVLFAGVPLTGGSDPTLDLGSLPVWPGVEMRAYRTFAPAHLGPGSLGGTLTLTPPPASLEPHTETWLAGGSLGAARMRASDSRPLGEGGANVTTALSASRSDDAFSYFSPDATGGDFATRRNAGHAQVSALFSLLQPMRLGDGDAPGAIRVSLLAQARRQGLPGTAIDPTPADRLDTARLLPVLEVTGAFGRGTAYARAFARHDQETLSTGPGSIAPPHRRDVFAAGGAAFGFRGPVGDRARIDVAIDATDERYVPGATTATPPPAPASRLATGLGADLDLTLARALAAAAAARVDVWSDDGTSAPGARTTVRPTGHVGLEAGRGPITAATHVGATARPPAFLELFGNRGAFLPNPALKTESAWSVDAGVRARDRAGDVRFDLGATGFLTFADDLITFVPVGAFGRARADNIGRARLAGLELEGEARLAPFTLRVVYTFLDAVNQGDGACGVALGRCDRPPLPGRPPHDLVGDLSARLGAWRLRYGADWIAGIAADLTGTVRVPARVLQSAGVRFEAPDALGFPGRLTADVEVKNVFDVRVVEYAGVSGPVTLPASDVWAYPLPGRTALASLRWVY